MIEKIAKNYGYTGKILWGDANDNGVVHKGMDNKKLLNWDQSQFKVSYL